jgi:hypothetical protein
LIRHIEEHGKDAHEESDNDQLHEREQPRKVRDWNRQNKRGTTEIAADQHGATREAINERARQQADEEEGEEVCKIQDRHLERTSV